MSSARRSARTPFEPRPAASSQQPLRRWKRHLYRTIAAEVSALTRYCDRVIHWLPREDDCGHLLSVIEAPERQCIRESASFSDLVAESDKRTVVFVNGTFNHHNDIQSLLAGLKPKLSRTSRLVVLLYNPYLGWAYRLANRCRLRTDSLAGPRIKPGSNV